MQKLSTVAKALGITKMTLWRWMYDGKIKFHKIGSMNYIDNETYNRLLGIQEKKEERVVIYARVSTPANKSDLQTQTQRLVDYCNARGYKIYKVVSEIGSSLDDDRQKLQRLLKEQNFTLLVVEHKDRLTRFGFNYIETLLLTKDIKIEVLNPVLDDEEDIIQDFTTVITSFCARIYGKRMSKSKTEKLIKELSQKDNTDLGNV